MNRKFLIVLIIALLVGAYVPLAFGQTAVAAVSKESIIRSQQSSSLLHRAYTVQDRRDFNAALEIYREYLRQGVTDLIRPSITDRDSIDVYLRHPLEPDRDVSKRALEVPSAPKDYVPPVQDLYSEKELTSLQRSTLQRAVRIGRCWDFPQFSAGFAQLCRKLVKNAIVLDTSGLRSDIQALQEKRLKEQERVVRTYVRETARQQRIQGTRGEPTQKTYTR